jgi:hypothetical protein
MPQRRTPARMRLVGLLTVALLASLVGVPSAAAATVDTSFSCPGTIASSGFTDITNHDVTTQRAIDCLAVHNITKGTSPTTFNPSGTVPRWQMALFLVRQAAAHGMTIPAPVDQGFTDLGGLSVEARDAVNQLAQLGITLGTSATTFSPNDDVTRWQMALFITRLLAGSGVVLPAPTDQGFGDLGGLPASAQNAIDQLAILGIAQGTSVTTFSPNTETLRWHMALFLTRALAVGGILPPGVKALVVSPGTSTYLDFKGTTVSRQYTVGVSTDGPFTIELWPASLIRANGTFEAASPGAIANCDVTLVDGVAASADKVSGIEPTGSTLTFTVGCIGTGDEVIPVVYTGTSLTGLTGASAVDAKAPTNDAVGIGGGVTVVVEAAAGAFGPVSVDGVDKAGNSFTSGGVTYFWDSNDTFKIGGVVVTMAEWIAALTTGDDLLSGSVYDPNPAGTSVFDLHDGAPVAPGLSLVGVTSTTATFTYTAAPGSDQIEIYACQGTGCETTLVRSVVAGTDEDAGTAGTQLVITGLTPATDYDFQAVQIEGTSSSEKSVSVDVNTPVALSIVGLTVTEPNDGANFWSGIRVDFDDVVAYDASLVLANFQIHSVDSPGTIISASTLINGANDSQILLVFPLQADTDPDTDWVLTIHAGALDVGAGGDPNGVLTAEFSH